MVNMKARRFHRLFLFVDGVQNEAGRHQRIIQMR
jgi:hypothetical protein